MARLSLRPNVVQFGPHGIHIQVCPAGRFKRWLKEENRLQPSDKLKLAYTRSAPALRPTPLLLPSWVDSDRPDQPDNGFSRASLYLQLELHTYYRNHTVMS